jgi:hypothetical protein
MIDLDMYLKISTKVLSTQQVWVEQHGNTGSMADALAAQGQRRQCSGGGDEQLGSRVTVLQQQWG